MLMHKYVACKHNVHNKEFQLICKAMRELWEYLEKYQQFLSLFDPDFYHKYDYTPENEESFKQEEMSTFFFITAGNKCFCVNNWNKTSPQ